MCTGSSSNKSKSTTSTTAPGSASTIPGSEWTKVSPASVGLDASKLDDIATTAQTNASNCLAVVRNGTVLVQWLPASDLHPYTDDGWQAGRQD